jgi:hypothetical protein
MTQMLRSTDLHGFLKRITDNYLLTNTLLSNYKLTTKQSLITI